jgi:hypothetical protein
VVSYFIPVSPPWEQEVGKGEDGRGAMGGGARGASMASVADEDVAGEAGRYGYNLIASALEKKSRGVAPRSSVPPPERSASESAA